MFKKIISFIGLGIFAATAVGYIQTTLPAKPALVQAVTVTKVTGGDAANMDWSSQINNENFKELLIKSLRHANFYHQFSGANYNLNVKLIKLGRASSASNASITCTVHYSLVTRWNGRIRYNKTLTISQVKKTHEEVVMANIAEFTQALNTLRPH